MFVRIIRKGAKQKRKERNSPSFTFFFLYPLLVGKIDLEIAFIKMMLGRNKNFKLKNSSHNMAATFGSYNRIIKMTNNID